MIIEEAAESLEKRLLKEQWHTAVGMGEHNGKPTLFLYVKKLRGIDISLVKEGWEGFSVEIRKMETPRIMAG